MLFSYSACLVLSCMECFVFMLWDGKVCCGDVCVVLLVLLSHCLASICFALLYFLTVVLCSIVRGMLSLSLSRVLLSCFVTACMHTTPGNPICIYSSTGNRDGKGVVGVHLHPSISQYMQYQASSSARSQGWCWVPGELNRYPDK